MSLTDCKPKGTEIDGQVLQNIIAGRVAGDRIEDVVGRQCQPVARCNLFGEFSSGTTVVSRCFAAADLENFVVYLKPTDYVPQRPKESFHVAGCAAILFAHASSLPLFLRFDNHR